MVARDHVGPHRRGWLLLGSLIIANVADLDFVPGLIVSHPGAFHHQATHSLAAAAMVSLLVGVLTSTWKLNGFWWGIWGGSVYLSHVVLDLLVNDPTSPFGVQLLWPFSQAYFISPITVFAKIDYFRSHLGILNSVFSIWNLGAILLEILLMAPFIGLAWYAGKSRREAYLER